MRIKDDGHHLYNAACRAGLDHERATREAELLEALLTVAPEGQRAPGNAVPAYTIQWPEIDGYAVFMLITEIGHEDMIRIMDAKTNAEFLAEEMVKLEAQLRKRQRGS